MTTTAARRLTEASDVTEADVADALDIIDGWYPEGSVDWEDVWDRMERRNNIDLSNDTDTPAMRKIQREVRKIKRAD